MFILENKEQALELSFGGQVGFLLSKAPRKQSLGMRKGWRCGRPQNS